VGRNSKEEHQANAMGKALQDHSHKKFWHYISKSKKSWPSIVEDATGHEAVTEMRKNLFAALLNSSKLCNWHFCDTKDKLT